MNTEKEPLVVYYGPLEQAGHYMFYDTGAKVPYRFSTTLTAWHCNEIDGTLQPGIVQERGRWVKQGSWPEGEAVIRRKDGWTALSFWDCTIDTRPGSSSTYLAKGTFTFDQMVALAKERFSERWNKMKFQVVANH